VAGRSPDGGVVYVGKSTRRGGPDRLPLPVVRPAKPQSALDPPRGGPSRFSLTSFVNHHPNGTLFAERLDHCPHEPPPVFDDVEKRPEWGVAGPHGDGADNRQLRGASTATSTTLSTSTTSSPEPTLLPPPVAHGSFCGDWQRLGLYRAADADVGN